MTLKTHKHVLSIALSLVLSTWASGASAVVAVMMAGASAANDQEEVEMGNPASLPPHNDGLVEVTAYYMDGPRFLICQPSSNDEVKFIGGRCMKRDGEAWLKERITRVPGVSPQQYLDRRFGEGATVFVGLGKRALSRNVDALVIFYRIPRP